MELSPPDPRVGQVLQGRYRIIDRLAAGAMGVVYRGERITLGRQVAVKFLHPWIAAQQAFRTRFETEARAMSRLSHPNCVSVIDFGLDGSPYVVMDFVPGFTLRHLLVEAGRLAPARAVGIARQILAGVAHAHAHGIIHRDLKPENLILGDAAGIADHVRILDFGLAKLRDGPAMTAGMAIGTPSYMSPEQTGAPGEIDGRTDIYAVGILLFEMLAGRKPFVSDKVADVLLMQRDAPPPSVRKMVPDAGISVDLEAVIDRALAKRSEDRFQTAAEMAQALDRVPEARLIRSPNDFPAPAPSAFGHATGAPALSGDKTIADLVPSHLSPAATAAAPSAPAAPAAVDATAVEERGLISPPVRRWIGLGVMAAVALGLIVIGARQQPVPPQPRATTPARPSTSVATAKPATPAAGNAAPSRAPTAEPPERAAGAHAAAPSATPTTTTPVAGSAGSATSATLNERLSRADELASAGDWQQALVVLEKAHHEHPDDAAVSYRQANLSLENKRLSEGAQAARAAGQHDRKLRSDDRLVKNLIRALGTDKGYEKTEDVLHGFGAGPVPLLKEAAAHDASPLVRQRAADLLRDLDGGRTRNASTSMSRAAQPAHAGHSFFSR